MCSKWFCWPRSRTGTGHLRRGAHNLKELRPTSNSTTAVRVLFVFDEQRQAVLLVAGDKATGSQWSSWYRTAIPLAEHRYREWTAQQRQDRP